MTQYLPPNLLALFAAREPVPYLAPCDKPTYEKKRNTYTGIADYLHYFEDPEETPPPTKAETKQEKLERKRQEKAELNAYKLEQDLALWNPNNNETATTDPYKTLFVSRINYNTSESKLLREFEAYGKIKKIKITHDINTGKPRGYAFIEYEQESDMHAAYKRADGKKIDGVRVAVDIERGRTIKGWRPRRLGGGKGGRKSHIVSKSDQPALDLVQDNYNDRRPSDRDRDRDRGDRDRLDRRGDRDRGDRDRTRRNSRERVKRSRSRDRKKRSKSKEHHHHHRSHSKDRVKKMRRGSREKDGGDLSSSSKSKKRSRSRDRKDRSGRAAAAGGGGGGSDENHNDQMNGNDNGNYQSNGNGKEPGEYVDNY